MATRPGAAGVAPTPRPAGAHRGVGFDRDRARALFGFDFALEMFTPKAKRRWGYFALPILHGDELVGKLDAHADRDRAVLRVNVVHEDIPFDAKLRHAVDAELAALARWLGLRLA